MRRTSDDSDLIARLRAGEERAVAELVSAYQRKILSMALRFLRNREDAEEVTQDVLVKVCQKIADFRGDSALSSWIYRISFNTVMTRLRGPRLREGALFGNPSSQDADDDPPARDTADWSAMADEHVMRRQMRVRLATAIGSLPPMYRVPVILRDVHGLSTEQASRELRLKDETLKSRLHRGRLMLRAQLADFACGVSLHRTA
jgi:RNA polymerase sigma-70 factor, ECF subfamily